VAIHRPHRHNRHLLLIVDHENARSTIEGPLTDYVPWIREVERARICGRQIDFRIVRESQAKIAARWGKDTEFERWPPKTVIDPFSGASE
jgi:hypothetical protein